MTIVSRRLFICIPLRVVTSLHVDVDVASCCILSMLNFLGIDSHVDLCSRLNFLDVELIFTLNILHVDFFHFSLTEGH